jgi:hypothetical protein
MKNCSSNCDGHILIEKIFDDTSNQLDCMNKVLKTRASEIVSPPPYFEIVEGTNTRPLLLLFIFLLL